MCPIFIVWRRRQKGTFNKNILLKIFWKLKLWYNFETEMIKYFYWRSPFVFSSIQWKLDTMQLWTFTIIVWTFLLESPSKCAYCTQMHYCCNVLFWPIAKFLELNPILLILITFYISPPRGLTFWTNCNSLILFLFYITSISRNY